MKTSYIYNGMDDSNLLSKTETAFIVLICFMAAGVATSFLMSGCTTAGIASDKVNADREAAGNKAIEDSLMREKADRDFAIAFLTGHEYWKTQKFEDSIKPLNKAAELDADRRYPQIFTELADSYIKLEKPDSALIIYQRAIARYPRNAFFYRNAAWLLTAKQQIPEAIEAYFKAIEIDNQTVSDYKNVGSLLVSANRNQEALSIYEKLTELDPNNAEAQKIYASLLLQTGNKDAVLDVK